MSDLLYLGRVDKYKLLKERKRICVPTKVLEYWRVRFSFLYFLPRKLCLGRVYCFHIVRPSVCASVRPSVTFCFFNISWSFMEFNQTLHTHSLIQGLYLK